jgi:MFS transporter, PPP family, 3-phenylpropionic acid transporter
VLALPQLARFVAPGAWGALSDRTGALRAIVVFACAANTACFALLPATPGFAAIAWLVGVTSLVASAALPLVEATTLAALGAESGRYGPIRLWGSVGFIGAVLAGEALLEPRASPQRFACRSRTALSMRFSRGTCSSSATAAG